MILSIKCECGKTYKVSDKSIGKKVKCKICNKIIEITDNQIKFSSTKIANNGAAIKNEKKQLGVKNNINIDTGKEQMNSSAIVLRYLALVLCVLQLIFLYILWSLTQVPESKETMQIISNMAGSFSQELLLPVIIIILFTLISVFTAGYLKTFKRKRICEATLIYWGFWYVLPLCFINSPYVGTFTYYIKNNIGPAFVLIGMWILYIFMLQYIIFYISILMGYKLKSPFGCIVHGYKNFWNISGRFSRHQYLFFMWSHTIFCSIILMGIAVLSTPYRFTPFSTFEKVFKSLILFTLFMPYFSAGVRRLHDMSLSFIYYAPVILYFSPLLVSRKHQAIPIKVSVLIGLVYLVITALSGTKGHNKYDNLKTTENSVLISIVVTAFWAVFSYVYPWVMVPAMR